jgi:outer membrane biosynthesis protein TonB
MSDRLDEFRGRRDGVTIPTIWIAIALSLLFHAAVMWRWLPHIRLPSLEDTKRVETNGALVVHLAPPPSPPPSPPSPPSALTLPSQPPPTLKATPPKVVVRPAPAPPVIALNQPTPALASPPPVAPPVPEPAPAPVRPPVAGDLASFIEARRRARGDATLATPPTPAAEDDNARANRVAIGNLTTQRQQTFGYDPRQGGGVFQIKRVTYDDAEFMFFGWNKEIRRNTKQLIEVRRGNNSDIRLAVIRKMIAIIREYEQTDFLWESQRLGRNIMLSARAGDNAGLEEFMMREFFPDLRPSSQ